MKTIAVRDAREGDRNAIRAVTLGAYEEYARAFPEPFWTAYRRMLVETLEGNGPAARIVAERQGAVVGSVLLYPAAAHAYGGVAEVGRWPEVRLLAVLPSERGQGVGRALMDECVRRARHAGALAVGLHTMDVMGTAVRLYARMGFEHVPSLDFNPVPGVVVKGYRLDLTTSPARG